jgi:uncharacterized protein (DUF2141 family)
MGQGAFWHPPPLPIGTYRRASLSEMLPAMHDKQRFKPFMKPPRGNLLLALSAFAASATAFAGDLTIEISGIAPDRGKIYVAVYDGPETFPVQGRQRVGQVVAPENAHFSVHFKNLPPGRYAAVAFQDFNGNGKLDKNFLGIPREPYGFSNGARGAAGAPKFSDAAITVDPNGTTSIVLK